jgi:hypothetical protein
LSANSDASANVRLLMYLLRSSYWISCQVESIAFDMDYRSRISRKKFEDACADLHDKFAQPILDAISKAGLDIVSYLISGIYNLQFCNRKTSRASSLLAERRERRWSKMPSRKQLES